jgi:hypothetical protein
MAGFLRQGWQHYTELGDKIENANRVATYRAGLEAGKSKAQAAFEAKDLLDYARRGNFQIAMIINDLVPFINARLQGIDKLGRAFRDHPGMVAAALFKIAAASVALAWLYDDDERYQLLPDWDKDNYWHVWIGAPHFRLPKPFEIGFLAGTMPERMYHSWIGHSQPPGKVIDAFGNGLVENLNLNPLQVQAVWPILEVVANKDFFFKTQIENQRDLGVAPWARYDARTSLTMIEAGKLTHAPLSPKQLEFMWRAYTGTMGAYALWAADRLTGAVTGAAERPAMRAEDAFFVGNFYRGTEVPRSTQYTIEFYENLKEVDSVYNTMKKLAKEGNVEEAKNVINDNRAVLAFHAKFDKTADALAKLGAREKQIMADREMAPMEKRLKLDEINRRRVDLTKGALTGTEGVF